MYGAVLLILFPRKNDDSTAGQLTTRVVYGDTDSVFVVFPGKSKASAFDLGEDIVRAVNDDNPKPVKLKFEKVSSVTRSKENIEKEPSHSI